MCVNVSFIIPVKNEERWIGQCLDAIFENMRHLPLSYEIVVVDDFSADQTLDIVKSRDQTQIKILENEQTQKKSHVSNMRNQGVRHSLGDVLILIDGDVILSPSWHIEFFKVYKQIQSTKLLTGSHCNIDRKANNWILTSWFSHLATKTHNMSHMNTGHLIISRVLFNEIGGFNEALETGEDYEFSQRAKDIGAIIINNINLDVVHKGYPLTLRSFFNRERWHGKGNWQIKRVNKMTFFIILFWLSLIVGIHGIFTPSLFIFLLIPIIIVCLTSVKRCGVTTDLPKCMLLATTLFIARGMSFIDFLYQRQVRASIRESI